MKNNARFTNKHESITDIMQSTGKGRDEVLNQLGLVQPPVFRSLEPFRSTRKEIKEAKALRSIPNGTLVQYFGMWSKFRPNWGGFIFNGVKVD